MHHLQKLVTPLNPTWNLIPSGHIFWVVTFLGSAIALVNLLSSFHCSASENSRAWALPVLAYPVIWKQCLPTGLATWEGGHSFTLQIWHRAVPLRSWVDLTPSEGKQPKRDLRSAATGFGRQSSTCPCGVSHQWLITSHTPHRQLPTSMCGQFWGAYFLPHSLIYQNKRLLWNSFTCSQLNRHMLTITDR